MSADSGYRIYEVTSVDGSGHGTGVKVGGHLVDEGSEEPGEDRDWTIFDFTKGEESGGFSARCISVYEGPFGTDGRPCSRSEAPS